jgi:uncharacterized protein
MEIRLTTFDFDSIEYLVPSWNDMDNIIFNIAKKINKDGLKFDKIVTLAKGGWPMARPLIDYTQVDELASIGLKFYSGINERLEKPIIYQDIPVEVKGEDILLFDDVADTGESLEFVFNYLKKRGVKSITTASLFYKPHSVIKPDYYGEETLSWIIFPYELKETMDVLISKWSRQGLEKQEILGRLEKMGFSKEKVEYFYNLLELAKSHQL